MTEWEPGIPVWPRPKAGYAAAPMFMLKEESHDPYFGTDAACWPEPFTTLDLDRNE